MAVLNYKKQTHNKLTTLDMEISLARFLNPRINLIVPNVSWGFSIHECDLLIVTPSNYLWEVEIKTSMADLKKDKEKYHKHIDDRIKRLYFAVPDYLNDVGKHIPERAGIIEVVSTGFARISKPPVDKKYPIKIQEKDRLKLLHLAAMRIWTLKRKIQSMATVAL